MRCGRMPRGSGVVILLGFLLAIALAAWGDVTSDPTGDASFESRVIGVARQLRLGISVASFAVAAPTIQDLRLHAQQLINLLEGSEGRHYIPPEGGDSVAIGLLAEVASWADRFQEVDVEPPLRVRWGVAARNVHAYLTIALDAALSILTERRFDAASTTMFRIYAYLAAAYEQPTGAPAIPALKTVLRGLGIVEPTRDR